MDNDHLSLLFGTGNFAYLTCHILLNASALAALIKECHSVITYKWKLLPRDLSRNTSISMPSMLGLAHPFLCPSSKESPYYFPAKNQARTARKISETASKYSTGRFPFASGSLQKTAPCPEMMILPAWNSMARKENRNPISCGMPLPRGIACLRWR